MIRRLAPILGITFIDILGFSMLIPLLPYFVTHFNASPVVVGVLFLLAMWLAPLASVIPAQATAPALILVGFYMMTLAREIAWDDADEALPAFITMLTMPFTWSITNGIGAGFIAYVVVKIVTGQARRVPFMLYLATLAFVVYFCVGVRP